MTEFEFTNTWFEDQRAIHEEFLKPMAEAGPVRLLEIGSHEGRSTVYFLQTLSKHPASSVTCIDPFDDSDSTSPVTNDTYRRFKENIAKVGTVTHLKDYSVNALAKLILEKAEFDYVLIDGSHLNRDVMLDACLVWHLVRPGGLIFFDDYQWGNPAISPAGPGLGIELWRQAYANDIDVLHTSYRLVVRKRESLPCLPHGH